MASQYRAAKSGFARDIERKLASKFDSAEAAKTLRWIRLLVPKSSVPEPFVKAVENIPNDINDVTMDDYADYLSNGLALGYLMACLDQCYASRLETVKAWKISENKMFETSRKRERIGLFLCFAQDYGVNSSSLFQTEQLYEKTNLPQVMVCLSQLGTEAQSKPDFNGPTGFWIHKHKENKREFTEEQLRSGENVLGLQSGYTKGANASGMTFGSRRHITDNF